MRRVVWTDARCRALSERQKAGASWAALAREAGVKTDTLRDRVGQWRRVQPAAAVVVPVAVAGVAGRSWVPMPAGHQVSWGAISGGAPWPGSVG